MLSIFRNGIVVAALLGALSSLAHSQIGVNCGTCGPWKSLSGQTVVIGSFASQEEADAAAADAGLQEAAVDAYIASQPATATCPSFCGTPPVVQICFPSLQTRDITWDVVVSQSGSGYLVTVTITGPNPGYRTCCVGCP